MSLVRRGIYHSIIPQLFITIPITINICDTLRVFVQMKYMLNMTDCKMHLCPFNNFFFKKGYDTTKTGY